jgi:methionine synthase II (cobalamin-independent)
MREEQLRAAEGTAILTVLELQRQTGIDVYSDGEYRRGMWITGLPEVRQGESNESTAKDGAHSDHPLW